MNIVILLVLSLSRPQALPVGQAELALYRSFLPPAARAASVVPGEEIPGQVVVGFEPGRSNDACRWIAALGGRVKRVDEASGFVVARCEQPAASLSGQVPAGVRYAVQDQRVHAARIPNDPYFLQEQWDKWVMYSDKAWDLSAGSMSVKVAVVDNGTDYTHSDLRDRFVSGHYGYDYVGMDYDPKPDNPLVPEAFHGTHVAGIVAATMDNALGVAGWAQVQLMAVRVLNDSGSGDLTALASGIRFAVDNGCKVVNMSLGADGTIPAVNEACQYAQDHGVLLVAASGNQSQGTIQYPAALSECVAVGALDDNSSLADFSNYGPEQEVVAPGTEVLSTGPGGAYLYASGTSMASPEVAGVAALLFSVDNSLSGSGVRAILAATALDKGASGRDEVYGYGIVNAWRAVQLAQLAKAGPVPSPATEPTPVIVSSGAFELPGWAQAAAVFDCQGRLVTRGDAGRVRLGAGTFFVDCSGPGKRELLVVRSVKARR